MSFNMFSLRPLDIYRQLVYSEGQSGCVYNRCLDYFQLCMCIGLSIPVETPAVDTSGGHSPKLCIGSPAPEDT